MFEKIKYESTFWWVQRVISVLLIPATIWLLLVAYSILSSSSDLTLSLAFNLFSQNYGYGSLFVGILVILHIRLGLEELVEDYIPDSLCKSICSFCLLLLAVRMIQDLYIWVI